MTDAETAEKNEGTAVKHWPAAAPVKRTVIFAPVTVVPLMATVTEQSEVVIVPPVTQPTLVMRPRFRPVCSR
jgi:hypothetical protein